ncbi:uncharacterized protein [Nicotiana tomentosiformis]|uniref:uncharacterized protein n=1 Tax=Nicotiana tomentosiformis TaxID=4098 RepID=UPI00388C59F0
MSVISLREILETNKLAGPNFDDWYRNLRIVLMHEKPIDVIDNPATIVPQENDVEGTKVYHKYLEECLAIKRIIPASVSFELQRKHQNMDPTVIIEYLKKMVDTQLDFGNSPVGPHVNHVIDLTEELEKLGYNLGKELSEDLILQSVYYAECFHCKKKSHWKRNYTGSGYNICNMLQRFRISRRLNKREVNLQVENSAKVAAIAVISISLIVHSDKVLILDDCYYVPKFISNIISTSMLDKRRFHINIGNGICSIHYDNDLYVNDYLQHDVYVLPNVNEDSIMHVSSLKKKRDDQVNHIYLWHCRLGHIGEKRIKKLYKEGYLDKYDFESYPTCQSCLKGKMTKSPFTGSGERAYELLGLIHTDVCELMKIQARGGYSYFITFTDYMSRYRFVYLMKHKSESFKMFKRFIGYPKELMGYYFYHLSDHKVFVAKGATFLERYEEELCEYIKVSGSTIIFLVLYVDDILLIGNEYRHCKVPRLGYLISMKDLGETSYILGIKIYRDRSRKLLGLSQSLYIDAILNRYNMDNSKRGYLPIGTGITLSREDCPKTPEERERMSKIPYASAVGAIMYTMTCTRPDVAYAFGVTSRYQENPSEEHWKVVKTILKYLRRTKDQFLIYVSPGFLLCTSRACGRYSSIS